MIGDIETGTLYLLRGTAAALISVHRARGLQETPKITQSMIDQ